MVLGGVLKFSCVLFEPWSYFDSVPSCILSFNDNDPANSMILVVPYYILQLMSIHNKILNVLSKYLRVVSGAMLAEYL